ncbi:WD40-repeat-containing domain protein [Linnemannia elongata]|nr:WD40-repeat-containing domain protein [Linnemannia elongata]
MLAASASTVDGTPTISIWLSVRKAIIKTLTGHLGEISCVVFSPDNQHVASGSADNTIRIWNIQSGAAIRILEGHSNVTSIAYSLNGDQIVSCSEDGTVQLWETSTGINFRTLDAEDYEIQCVAFSPTGPWVAGGGEDGVVRLWDINSGADGPVLSGGHDGSVNSVAFSPDGIHVASAGGDNTVRIWSINTGTRLHVLVGHMDPVRCLSFSPSGDRVLSGGADRTVREWDVATGTFLEPLAHTNSVDGLSISSDGAQLWTVSDGRVHVWTNDVFAVKQVAPASSFDFSRDCKQVAWSLGGNKVQLFDVGTGEPGLVFHGDCDTIECVSYSPVHNVIAAASSDSTIQIWDSVQGGCLETLQGQGVFTSFVFSPDGMQIAMTSETMCRLLNLEPEILLKAGNQCELRLEGILGSKINNESATAQGLPKLITGYVDHTVEVIASPVYSPDGNEISVGAADFTVHRFPTRSEVESPAPLVGHHDIVTCISYSLLGDKIATGSGDSTARIWDRYTGEQLFLLSGHSGGVTSIAFAPFKDQVATGDNDFSIWLWDLAQSGSVHSLQGHKGSILCVAYSPDGKILASGSADRTMRLWDTISGICLAEVRDFTAGVESIRWMGKRGGYRLATGSVENPLGVWELVEDRDETGKIRQRVRRCWGAGVHALAVSGARVSQEHGLKLADAWKHRWKNQ